MEIGKYFGSDSEKDSELWKVGPDPKLFENPNPDKKK
jgi:hypothetical protein